MSVPRFARVTDRQLRAWVLRGYPASRIAALMGCSQEAVARRVQALWRDAQDRGNTTPPTPEEIAERSAEIRATWSEEERQRRAGCSRASVEATVVPESYLQRLRPGGR